MEANKENVRGVGAKAFVAVKVGMILVMDAMGLLVVRDSMNVF